MKIKTKLALALSLLFVLILTLSGLAVRHVRQLAGDTKNILEANYQSLDYSRNMYKLLDNPAGDKIATEKFQAFLDRQKMNITEVGERELTTDLQEDFNLLLNDFDNPVLMQKVRSDLNSIMKLNMDAILRKSNTAAKTADEAILWISLASAFCFIIGFTIIINLPGYIANPIRDLTESIGQIAAKNYSQRIYFKGHDEFAALARSFNTMAEKLQEYSNSNLEKLVMEKRRIETLISNLNDPVIGLDDTNKILFINDEAIKISGLNKDKVLGHQAEQVALYNDLLRSLLQHPEKAASGPDEPIKIYADGRESYFERYIVPISIIPTGETVAKNIGSFMILKNITAYKELDSAKTNFIATVSHEFKTPIAAMKMSLQLLGNERTGKLNEEQKDLIAGINDDTERLLRTTGELLNITQVETGKTALTIESAETESVVADAIEANWAASGAKKIEVVSSIQPGFPDILADREKATWIVSNLLSNAIRYSHENSTVSITGEIKENNILIAVKDSGTGIPEEYLPKVFDKYFRVPGTIKEGTGLGLAISKEFMEAQGGIITVESTQGKGSTFTLHFKRAF
jgi:NtrC-family two-component system sensor histidine kinase KinB